MATREEIEHWAFDLLASRRFAEVGELVCEFERAQDPPRGINVPWASVAYRESFVWGIERMFEMRPAILGELSEDQWNRLSLRAAMLEVTGAARLPKRLFIQPVKARYFNDETAARMIYFAMRAVQDVSTWRPIGIHWARLIAAPDACEHCSSFEGALYRLNDLPETPHPSCTNTKYGCRCSPSPIFEDDDCKRVST